jgi:lincosamide nucleotidyltransferase A/C/D/E
MEATDAVALYRLLTGGGRSCWVVGGWGIDALLGRQTRPHHDLDVLTLLADLPAHEELLAAHGFARTLVWEENRWAGDRPTAFVMEDAAGRQLDVHVLASRSEPAWATSDPCRPEDLAGRGTIAGTPVACATAAAQVAWHSGYELPPAHVQDLRLLRAAGGAVPPPGQ